MTSNFEKRRQSTSLIFEYLQIQMTKSAHIIASILILMINSLTSLNGQTDRVTHLKEVISNLTSSPEKVDSILALSHVLRNTSRAESLRLAQRASSLSEKIDYQRGYERAVGRLGLLYYNNGRYDSAGILINTHINLLKQSADSAQLANDLSLLGAIQANLNNEDRGFELLTQALGISTRHGHHRTALYTYNRLANILVTKDLSAAISYLNEAYEFAISQDMLQEATKLAVNLSILEDDPEVKLGYLDKALKSAKELNLIDAQATAYSSKAGIYDLQGDYKSSINAYRQAIRLFNSIGDSIKMAETKCYLGLVYINDRQFEIAEEHLKSGLEVAFRNENKWMHQSVLYGLAQAYAGQNNYRLAHDSLEQSYLLVQEYYRQLLDDRLQELNKKFDTSNKEKEIARQELLLEQEKNKRSRQLLLGLSIFSLALIIGGLIFIRQRKKRRETNHKLQLREVEAASLKELDEMKSRWFENISHDIRTPLTLISAPISDVLKTTKSTNTSQLLTIAKRNAEQLLQLTDEMLELARLENNIVPIRLSKVHAVNEIRKIIHAFDSFAEQKGIALTSKTDIVPNQYIEVDLDKYEKICNNLIKNAINYSPQNTTVHVDVKLDLDQLITNIIDEGPGISKEEMPHLFDKYFRAGHEQSQMVVGSGLGLSIVKELVDLLNGQISVKNNIGQGCTFSVQFPVQVLAAASPLKNAPTIEESHVTNTSVTSSMIGEQHILIVEDHDEMRSYLAMTLGNNYQVHTAENPEIALQMLSQNTIQLILSDIMMPGMDGFEFKKRVNVNEEFKDIPFIFLSARVLDEDKLKGLRLGVDDYITKPFLTDELKVRIHNILSRQIERESARQELLVETDNKIKLELPTIAERAAEIVQQNLADVQFGVDQLAEALSYSSRQLSRILKSQTGMTSVQFILELRLLQARALLLSKKFYSVKEVQFEVGIQSQSYFSRKYTERFGRPPSDALG